VRDWRERIRNVKKTYDQWGLKICYWTKTKIKRGEKEIRTFKGLRESQDFFDGIRAKGLVRSWEKKGY